ncbi:hypothetical protein ACJDU8_12820 [Clostridium sp. WILCCON 0269]|uniref:Replicative helicase inhibitor G39P N-terminal domain-containing protein n=1 Tax=Candidatus Clostridium eludens TaxID=3381663 RepID=A0ABW8SMI8_9CLOT
MLLDKQIFKEGMKELALAFTLDLKAEQMDVWYKYCQDLRESEFKKKINNCIKFCRHKPYIADLLDIKERDTFEPANAGAYEYV